MPPLSGRGHDQSLRKIARNSNLLTSPGAIQTGTQSKIDNPYDRLEERGISPQAFSDAQKRLFNTLCRLL
jgi:hypothetical protein